jgi:Holliday junction resolvase RusA-like endonuclease
MPNGAMLPAGTTASRKRATDWRNDCKHAALLAMGDRPPTRSAVRLQVEFSLAYPVSTIRKSQLGWYPAVKQPDVDKLQRGLFDALTGIVWVDDSQVVFVHANKNYAWNGSTGAHVTADFLDDDWLRSFATNRAALVAAMGRAGIDA